MYAIIETGGKQYKVTAGDEILVEKLSAEPGTEVEFKVLMLVDEAAILVGKPVLKGMSAKAKIIEHGKGDKVVVFKYKPKKDYRKKQGHRQPYSKVQIVSIG